MLLPGSTRTAPALRRTWKRRRNPPRTRLGYRTRPLTAEVAMTLARHAVRDRDLYATVVA